MSIYKNIVIIGSGVMGAGIAEQFANTENKVFLMDIVTNNPDRNFLANQAIAKIATNLDIASKYIIPCNLEDNLEILSSADLIIEAIIEEIDIKKELYKKLNKICKKGVVITSNTSTIRLAELLDGMDEEFRKHFLITHFFNPPRYMQLLELITAQETDKNLVSSLSKFLTNILGKTVIKSNDTPGFIANRIGFYWLQTALNTAIEMKKTIEEVDYLMSIPLGIPKTGIFGLLDLIGIDVSQLILKSLSSNLSSNDQLTKDYNKCPILEQLIANNQVGRKSGQGFYRITRNKDGSKTIEVLDLNNLKYRNFKSINLNYSNISEVIENDTFAKQVLCKTLGYVASLLGEVSDNINDIDTAIKLGFNWKYGPFEMIDQIGAATIKTFLTEQNIAIPKIINEIKNNKFYSNNSYYSSRGYIKNIQRDEYLLVSDIPKEIFSNEAIVAAELDKDIAVLTIKTKLGILKHEVFEGIIDFFENHSKNFSKLIITNDQNNFSAGADLKFILSSIKSNNLGACRDYLSLGSRAIQKIKYSSIPVIIGFKGLAYGGGCEILLHTNNIVSHLESRIGLVECKIGLIPGWGGCKELMIRTNTEEERIEAFKNIAYAHEFKSAHKFASNFHFKHLTKFANPNMVLHEANHITLDNEISLRPTEAKYIEINWSEVLDSLKLEGYAKEVAKNLMAVFSMRDLKESSIIQKEQEIFLSLLKNRETIAKIESIL